MSKWALITGAAKRIGREIALELAGHGWNIVVHYSQSAGEAVQLAGQIQDLGQSACLAEIDLSDPEMTEKLIPSMAQELGPLGALINNAALFEPDALDPDASRHWAINADAPRILSKSFKAHLPKGAKGVIVNMLDATPPAPNFSAYNKSKVFLSDMTLNMAKSFAPQVRVNGVAPLFVFPSPRQTEEGFKKMAKDKIVSPEKVAQTVRRLVEALDTTGEILTVS